ncbi:MAG: TonB-dependent receptor [Desulfosalsimonadaceae bacterium]
MIRRCNGCVRMAMVIALLILAGTALGAAAEKPENENSSETPKQNESIQNTVFTLGEIEVIGFAEESKNMTTEKVYDDEMRLFNRDNLADAVNLSPGVTLSESGARNEKMIYVRGFDIKHVPIFLDGIPIYVPYDGYPDLVRFSTFDLSEVVVSKGFTSVLYGPNTMGGAINMVSRRPVKEFEASAGTGYGSGAEFRNFANFGTNQEKWYVQGGGAYSTRDHFSVANDFTQTEIQGDGERVNSGQTDTKGNIKLGLTPKGTDEYAISYINQQGDKDVPPYTGSDSRVTPRWWRWPDWDKESVYLNTKTAVWDRSYVKTRLFYDTFKNALYAYDDSTFTTMEKKSSFKSYYDDYTYGGSMEIGSGFLPDNLIKAAFHYKEDIHREHNAGNPVQHFEDNIISIGIEDTIDFTPKFYSIAGAGYDTANTVEAQELDSSTKTLKDFPDGDTSAFNPQAGLFYKLTDTATIHTSVAGKSRLPSIKDRYSYKMGTALPNPDLDPEKAVNYEAGYQGFFIKDFTLETNVFYSDITDFILLQTVPDPDDPEKTLTQNRNVGEVHQYGAEFGVSGQILACLNGGVNYTYIHYNNESGPDKLLNIPNHKIFTHLQYRLPVTGLSLLGSVEFNGDRYSSSDGVRVADSYTLVAAKAIYEMPKGFSVEGGVNNLTDENYALDEGYPPAGRSYFANLSYKY